MTLTTGILQFGTGSHLTSSEEANALATDFVTPGVVGLLANTGGTAPATGNFAVNAQGSPDATVAVGSGVAYVTGTPTSQGSQTFRVKNSASANVTISANSSGSTKYDWIYISLSSTNLANPNTAADNVATLVASRSSSASADDGTPPTYGLLLAVVTVANGFSTITNGNISDRRTQATNTTTAAGTSNGWQALGYTPNTVTNNGNGSYSMVFNSVDLTGTVSNGMRLKTTRTVTAPTQCTSLNGTTQYYSKSSPAGMTFTDDFTCMAWVKLSSYAAGGIIARRNASTEGFSLSVTSTGQVEIAGLRIAANFKTGTSYQSIPLNKWVHVAATLDMSADTTTIYIDGVSVPAVTATTGTATALVQGTSALTVGSQQAAGANYFPGKIAQAAVFSAVLSAATIRSYISQGLSGPETSLISAYSFNNSINDLNANANNLTANGAAVATNADSPFAQDDTGTPSGTTDFAIIMSKTFSTNTTLTVQVPEGCTIPTSGGVSAVSYSTQGTPYGFPGKQERWCLESHIKYDAGTVAPVAGTWYNSTLQNITVPIGAWNLGYEGSFGGYKTSATEVTFKATLSTANNSESDRTMTTAVNVGGPSGTAVIRASVSKQQPVSVAAATTYYSNFSAATASSNSIDILGGTLNPFIIRAENAYL